MQQIRELWKKIVEEELEAYGLELLGSNEPIRAAGELTLQKPPKPEMGDIAFPLFTYAKALKSSPQQIAQTLKERLSKRSDLPKGEVLTAGPYLNIKVDVTQLAERLYREVLSEGERFGSNQTLAGKRVMVEFSCPNTNKPLHLGHLRNDALGESISAILKANGAEVHKVSLINNRGIHICKSMLAYQKVAIGETPDSSGL